MAVEAGTVSTGTGPGRAGPVRPPFGASWRCPVESLSKSTRFPEVGAGQQPASDMDAGSRTQAGGD
jgi:hypothetical protein